jgi:hypothetical protein
MLREIKKNAIESRNFLKSNVYMMHHFQQLYFLLTYLFLICTDLRISRDYLPIDHRLASVMDHASVYCAVKN